MSRVSGQVEKDVDPVRPDLLRQPLVAHAEHIAPLGRGGLKTMRQIVLDDSVGVTDRLMLFPVEVFQDADQEIADRVPPQIGRNEAQAEPAMTITGVRHAVRRRRAGAPRAGDRTRHGLRLMLPASHPGNTGA